MASRYTRIFDDWFEQIQQQHFMLGYYFFSRSSKINRVIKAAADAASPTTKGAREPGNDGPAWTTGRRGLRCILVSGRLR